MSRCLWIWIVLALLLSACQPVMPVETAAPAAAAEDTPAGYPELPGEILIPAGSFSMGCDKGNSAAPCRSVTLPLHPVTLDAYYIDQYEVTNARYQACVDAGVCTPPKSADSISREVYFGSPDYADYPVILVDWFQATEFCAWDGKRLPTEAEWMKAARGADDTRMYPWGNEPPTCELANSYGGLTDCGGDTAAVGSHPAGASPYGVMDMAGNIGEWVNDWYDPDYYTVSPLDNPQGPDSGVDRVRMGGRFDSVALHVSLGTRTSWNPKEFDRMTGFRCAHSP